MDKPAKRKRIVGGRPYEKGPPDETIRWRSWRPFQRAAEPIFVLNRHRRIDFLPFRDEAGLLFILGRITTGAAPAAPGSAALSEGALALREAVLRRHGL